MRNIVASGMLYGKHITVKQISKPTARKLFCSGKTIYMQSSNMYPFGLWQNVCSIDKKICDINLKGIDKDNFNIICNEYKYYNCCSERGKYINFYKTI